jgi:hypothetical protein
MDSEREVIRELEQLRQLMEELPLEPRHRAFMISLRVFSGITLGTFFTVATLIVIMASLAIGSAAPFSDFVKMLLGLSTCAVGGVGLYKGFAKVARRLERAAFRFAWRRFQAAGIVPSLTSGATSAAIPGTLRAIERN